MIGSPPAPHMFGQYESLVCALISRMHLRDFREYVCAPFISMKVLNKDFADVAQVSVQMLLAYTRVCLSYICNHKVINCH